MTTQPDLPAKIRFDTNVVCIYIVIQPFVNDSLRTDQTLHG